MLALVIWTGCSALHLDSRREAVPVWMTEGESPRRGNAVPAQIEPPLEVRWEFNAGAGFGSVSPLIIGDVIFAPTRKGEIHAIDLETGGRLGQTSFGESIEGTPAIKDGVLFVPVAWGGTTLYAYDLFRASTMWRVKGVPIQAGLLVHEDRVIAADVEGHVRAYRVTDGEELWSRPLADRAGVRAAPVLVGEHVIVGDDGGGVTALRASDGSLVWSTDVGAPVLATPAANDETVFVPTSRGELVALNVESGTRKWGVRATTEEVYVASPAVGAWEVVFGASDGIVRSVDPESGSKLWESDLEAAVTAPPLITGGVVYVGTMRSKLVGLSRSDGARLWETQLEGRMKSALAATGERLVVLAEPRIVYLFEEAAESYAVDVD